jgi:CRISPR-associated protein Cas5d
MVVYMVIAMNGHQYFIGMEVSGPYALFNRNDICGNCDRSYPAPSYSAVQNIFGSIMTWKNVNIIPVKVEICNPLVYHQITFNEGHQDGNTQVTAYVLHNVRYKLYARLEAPFLPEYNPRHAFQVRFNCRLKYKKKLHNPFIYLGRREFRATYVGHLDPNTHPCLNVHEQIHGMFKQLDGKVTQTYPTVEIKAGTMVYD